ncbi:MAG TPA: Asp-tRNA(Asn)/Glu-tRNA(Gln) amidotransferase subunit GatB [Acidimicrobiia bacterium]|nr:Asp-tRNA(Asn)/Glu-tRNA(Gln) amidotransferase subunit GatB [Acidimicrobiia bacterium]
MSWEAVIGLEVHVELATMTKLFCGCRNEFGAEPNTNICPVCLGLPGSLPVLNERVVEFALRLGEALDFTVPTQSIFHRKNYFYPDMPKDYQVSQYDEPICVDGRLAVDGVEIGIERAHMEEDTGKTTHVGGGGRIHDAVHSLVDYNRAGVPLLEIVSHPDMRSAGQARGYVSELRAVLQAIGVSDVKMEEGSMRVDANVSVRQAGTSELGTKVEVKNMNSLRSLGRAIEFEIDRQTELADAETRIVQETRHWDEADGVTHAMRTKEGSQDYRYFPEPDLVPVAPDDEMRARARASATELPTARRARLVEQWGINEPDAEVLLGVSGLADYAEAAVAAGAAGADATKWIVGDVLGFLNETGAPITELPLRPDGLAELLVLLADGSLNRNLAREVLAVCLAEPKRPRAVVDERGLAQVSDEGELGALIDAVLVGNADAVADWRSGDDKAKKKKRGFLFGEVMKSAKGAGDPKVLGPLLDERLGAE